MPIEKGENNMLRAPSNLVTAAVAASLLMLGSTPVAAQEHPHWSYSGPTGPAKWGSLEKEYSACAIGKNESPIDIRDTIAKKTDLPAINFDYQASTLKIIDNGHTIQINYAPGSFITVGSTQYELVQFHFHKPSEEKLNGKSYDMVAHLVHKDKEGKLAVVAVLLAKGTANPLIKTLWDNLPKEKETEAVVDAVKINVADLLPKNQTYYTYTGSLTTPPCSEGVTWFVLKHPTSVSAGEIARFAKSYPMNARPVQPLNGREIRVSE
jgi:carbonic anhydrase